MSISSDLIAFELEVKREFEAGHILGPVHLAGGNEGQLIDIFKKVGKKDWICATYRSHYHALLHGIPRSEVMAEIMAGRSMNLSFPGHRFLTSAIVGGILPIAVGIALGLKVSGSKEHVWCFVGDMAASIGAFYEANTYAMRNDLPITFVIEDNGLSCDSPTEACWGQQPIRDKTLRYFYERGYPHVGTGTYVSF